MDDRKQYVEGCKFTWNIDSNEYRITDILKMKEVKANTQRSEKVNVGFPPVPWNPTKLIIPQMRKKIQQPYAHRVRYLSNELALAGLIFKITSIFFN